MQWETIGALAAAAILFATFVKALPSIWGFVMGLFGFLRGVEHVASIPELQTSQQEIRDLIEETSTFGRQDEILDKLDDLNTALRDHMAEEERLRGKDEELKRQEASMVAEIVAQIQDLKHALSVFTIESSRAAFRQAVLADENAYYEIVRVGNEWILDWINRSYERLTGNDLNAARVNPYSTVAKQDIVRVVAAANYAGTHSIPLKVDYVNVNPKTGERTNVELRALPIKDLEGKVVSYFGVIQPA